MKIVYQRFVTSLFQLEHSVNNEVIWNSCLETLLIKCWFFKRSWLGKKVCRSLNLCWYFLASMKIVFSKKWILKCVQICPVFIIGTVWKVQSHISLIIKVLYGKYNTGVSKCSTVILILVCSQYSKQPLYNFTHLCGFFTLIKWIHKDHSKDAFPRSYKGCYLKALLFFSAISA